MNGINWILTFGLLQRINVSQYIFLQVIRPCRGKAFNINDSVVMELLTRLGLGFSQLRGRHGFRDILNHLRPCSMEAERHKQVYFSYNR